MPTKSGVLYQRMLFVKQILKDIPIKHYDQARYAEIVEEIFSRNIGLIGEYDDDCIKGISIKHKDVFCSDSSPCEYQTDEDGEPIDHDNIFGEDEDEVSGKESIVIEDDSVRGES